MTFTKRTLGRGGPEVSAVGLGCMGMSEFYGRSDREAALATIAAALEAGVTLLDTGDFYGMGHNEMLLGEALSGRRDKAFIQVKFGALRGPDGAFLGINAQPSSVKTSLAYSLRRLGTDHVDLYQTGLDPEVPVEETIGAIGDLVTQGYVRHVGITNVDADTIRRAHKTHTITALQFEYGLMSRDIEHEILPVCRELGIGITAYGVLGRGLLTGSKGSGEGDIAQLAAIRAGFGIGVCQVVIAASNPELTRVLPEAFAPELETWVVMHEDMRTNVPCRVVFDALVDFLKDLSRPQIGGREGGVSAVSAPTPRP